MHEVKPVTEGTRITVTYLIDTKEDKDDYMSCYYRSLSKDFFCGPVDATMNLSKVHKLLDHLNGMKDTRRRGRFREGHFSYMNIDSRVARLNCQDWNVSLSQVH